MPRKKKVPAPAPVEVTAAEPEIEQEQADATEAEISADIAEAPKKNIAQKLADGLKSRLLGIGDDDSDEPPEQKAVISKGRANTLAQQMCFLMSMCVMWLMDAALSEPYKSIAPNRDEAQAMTLPLARIIARKIKAKGKLSEDTIDYLMMITAIVMYTDRAKTTYKNIRAYLIAERAEHENGGTPVSHKEALAVNNAGVTGYPSGGQARASGTSHSERGVDESRTSANGTDGRTIDPMDALLAADALGRAQYGLS